MTTCPICKSYMSIKNSLFAHYLSNHDKGQIVRNKIFDDGKCIICKKNFSSFEEFLNHLMNEHVNKTIEIFSTSKKMIEFFKDFVQPISQVTIPENNEEQLKYFQFIASDVSCSCIDSEKVVLSKVTPSRIAPVEKENKPAVNNDFWNDLEKIYTSCFDHIDLNPETNMYLCKRCKTQFDSMTKLFQHLWEHHQKEGSKFK